MFRQNYRSYDKFSMLYELKQKTKTKKKKLGLPAVPRPYFMYYPTGDVIHLVL